MTSNGVMAGTLRYVTEFRRFDANYITVVEVRPILPQKQPIMIYGDILRLLRNTLKTGAPHSTAKTELCYSARPSQQQLSSGCFFVT